MNKSLVDITCENRYMYMHNELGRLKI